MTDTDATAALTRPTRPWCLFRSGSEAFAVGLESVAEVVEVDRLVRLPHSPPGVVGVCTLRREVVPVVALGRSEGAGGEPGGWGSLVLILKSPSGPWALSASGEGTMLADEPLDPSDGPAGGAGNTAVYLGTIRHGETVHAAIDPDATWRIVRESVERWYAGHWVRLASARRSDSFPTPTGGARAESPFRPAAHRGRP